MAGLIAGLFSNRIFLTVILTVLFADIIKMMIYYLLFSRINLRLIFKTGGMPSAHTAAVSSLATALYLNSGVTDLFVVTLFYSFIVIGDAIGFRRSIGRQAEIINKLVEDIAMFRRFKTRQLYELIGHTPKQVLMGGILGICSAIILHLIL
jgi:uncharacterized protein